MPKLVPSIKSQSTSLQVRNVPGAAVEETHLAIRRGLAIASLEKREGFKANQTLERSWSGATLLSMQSPAGTTSDKLNVSASLTVTCTTCYVKGIINVEVQVKDNFNASAAIESTKTSVVDNLQNLTNTFEDYLYSGGVTCVHILPPILAATDFALPTFPFAFDLDVPEIPESNLRIQFDDLELLIELETVLAVSATHEINLYSSVSPVGIKIGPMLQLGLIAAVDLIFSVQTVDDIRISTGFHIKFNDGVEFNLALFGDKVSHVRFNGGQFEFLPVRVESAGMVIAAVLRIGIHCGVEVVKAGIEVAVVAHLAILANNQANQSVSKSLDCSLEVIQEYNLALGAIAGASVEVNADTSQTYGPVIEKPTAIFTTTLAKICVISEPNRKETSITNAALKRQDMTTTTLSTVITTSGVSCMITGAASCPASQQNSTKASYTKYWTTALPSSVTPTFPESTLNNIPSRRHCGTGAKTIRAMSGSPSAYTAPPTPTGNTESQDGNAPEEAKSGVNKSVAIGAGVGLGLPLLAAIVGAIL
ncbi:hypothetical protein CC86DRAFT_395030 [Ophiobolus disseminans]|uniref:Uncharacterized protein n=1 Tax=Ophiobolus disseminans TaxID=1469910 RepID=A0A6A6ZYC3_9PLEO|nr:hypothetical protein CC86DRAFT_395030 [Ophiobolus disseminans]